MSSADDVFNVPEDAKLFNSSSGSGYTAIAAVLDGPEQVGYARFNISEWSTGRGRQNRSTPMAEVLLHRSQTGMTVPEDGVIGEDDPAYEALKRGELLWCGHLFGLRWMDRAEALEAHERFFAGG